MADSLEKFEEELRLIGKLFWAINYKSEWSKTRFSFEKACVCPAFSKIVYDAISMPHDRCS